MRLTRKQFAVTVAAITMALTSVAYAAYYDGNAQNNTWLGTPNADLAYGREGNDWLDGKGGQDVINGGKNADHVFGGDNPDYLVGGQGPDILYGEGGDDELRTNGDWPESDVLDCGGGTDKWAADSSDYVAANCEIHVGKR